MTIADVAYLMIALLLGIGVAATVALIYLMATENGEND